jgi:hypothetical protein
MQIFAIMLEEKQFGSKERNFFLIALLMEGG